MTVRGRSGVAVLAGAVAAMWAASAAALPDSNEVIADVSELERVRAWNFDQLYVRPGVDPLRYTRFWLESARVHRGLDPRIPRIEPGELQRVAESFDLRLLRALAGRYPLVDGPGPGVVRIRPIVTGLRYNRPPLDYDRLRGLEAGSESRTNRRPRTVYATVVGVGEVWMQTEFYDGESGELLMVVCDKHEGRQLERNTRRMITWADVHEGFQMWSNRLRRRLDDLHGEAPAPAPIEP